MTAPDSDQRVNRFLQALAILEQTGDPAPGYPWRADPGRISRLRTAPAFGRGRQTGRRHPAVVVGGSELASSSLAPCLVLGRSRRPRRLGRCDHDSWPACSRRRDSAWGSLISLGAISLRIDSLGRAQETGCDTNRCTEDQVSREVLPECFAVVL
jgi:hypothetical protein